MRHTLHIIVEAIATHATRQSIKINYWVAPLWLLWLRPRNVP